MVQQSFHASRRAFLKQMTAAALGAPFITRGLLAASPNSQLAHASFGASGMAWADLTSLAKHSAVRIVAAADRTGIGLTLLPVFYAHANFGAAAPTHESSVSTPSVLRLESTSPDSRTSPSP